VRWQFGDRPAKTYAGPLVTRVFSKRGTVTATAIIDGLPQQQVKVTVELPPLQLLSVKVARATVTARVRANVSGTVRLRLGKLPQVTRQVKAGQVFTKTFKVRSASLRTMMLQARLAPKSKPRLPNPKLLRAVVLPLR